MIQDSCLHLYHVPNFQHNVMSYTGYAQYIFNKWINEHLGYGSGKYPDSGRMLSTIEKEKSCGLKT